MKLILTLFFLLSALPALACDDSAADVVAERALARMAKRYDSKKVAMGVAMLLGEIKVISIAVLEGIGAPGERVDRMGTIYVNMNDCKVKGTLIGTFETIDLAVSGGSESDR